MGQMCKLQRKGSIVIATPGYVSTSSVMPNSLAFIQFEPLLVDSIEIRLECRNVSSFEIIMLAVYGSHS